MTDIRIPGRGLIEGEAQGRLLVSDVGLSFWGGVDPLNGDIIDRHHPLHGQNLAGRVLVIPGGRGSCSGSSVLLELILNGHAPAALVFTETEEILTLGVLVAEIIFKLSLPVLCIDHDAFGNFGDEFFARIGSSSLTLLKKQPDDDWSAGQYESSAASNEPSASKLEEIDRELLDGVHGKAAQVAMQIVLRVAALQGSERLISITQAHIDGCVYNGPASLRFALQLVEWGGRVRVPTTLNAISVDQRRWREQGIDPDFGEPAGQLGDAYMDMGAQLSFTCAPYLLDTAPVFGEQIVWAESNAVAYANSVIGARTRKYPDFMDICIALTGRAPLIGSHLDAGRNASLIINMPALSRLDDSFWPLAGYHVGLVAGRAIPLIRGLDIFAPTSDDLKAFSAAFATTSSAAMFHIAGITPEAAEASRQAKHSKTYMAEKTVPLADLLRSWQELNTARDPRVDLVSFGNPHFSLTECKRLAELCTGRTRHPDVRVAVTLGRMIHERAIVDGHVTTMEDFGIQFITDTCWCMLQEPVVPPGARTLMTNSAKYAHYAPGLVGRDVHFGSMADCVDGACCGYHAECIPAWLFAELR